jgi:DNA-binding XRE family transcriptional regulator
MPPSNAPEPRKSTSNIGRNLRHLAGMHDLNRAELAHAIGISTTSLSNIVQGRSEPTMRTALIASRVFGIAVDDLYAELDDCLRAAAERFSSAPVRQARAARVSPQIAIDAAAKSASGANDQVKSTIPDTITANPMQA